MCSKNIWPSFEILEMKRLGFWRNSHFWNRSSKEKRKNYLRNLRVPKQEQMISKVVGFTHNHNKKKTHA
jgi:hypothetical protein